MLLGYIALASLSLIAPFDPSADAEQTISMECDEVEDDCCPVGKIPGADVDVGDVEDCFYGSLRYDHDSLTATTF